MLINFLYKDINNEINNILNGGLKLIMDSEKSYPYGEYMKKFPGNFRASEYEKLFKLRGRTENKHIRFNLCPSCISILYSNPNKLSFNVRNGILQSININIQLCESCIERNLYEVNSYVYKSSLKRLSSLNDEYGMFKFDDEDNNKDIVKRDVVMEKSAEGPKSTDIPEVIKKKPYRRKKPAKKSEEPIANIIVIDD